MNFIEKDMWNESEWDIFLNNLDILRKKRGLSKGELNKRVGRWNLFRKIKKRPQRETISGICQFFGVDEEWLSTPHLGVKDPETENISDPHNPKSTEGYPLESAKQMLKKIYASGDFLLINAIYSNLRAFSAATENKSRIDNLELELAELKAIVQKHARAATNRRQIVGVSPTGIERRSGEDRRKMWRDGNGNPAE